MLSPRPSSAITTFSWPLLCGVATAIAGLGAVCSSVSREAPAPQTPRRSQLRTAQPSPIKIASVAILPEHSEDFAELAAQWMVPPPPAYALFLQRGVPSAALSI